MKNWRTTTLGALTIIGAITSAAMQYLHGGHVDFTTLGATVAGGWGLLHAADAASANP